MEMCTSSKSVTAPTDSDEWKTFERTCAQSDTRTTMRPTPLPRRTPVRRAVRKYRLRNWMALAKLGPTTCERLASSPQMMYIEPLMRIFSTFRGLERKDFNLLETRCNGTHIVFIRK